MNQPTKRRSSGQMLSRAAAICAALLLSGVTANAQALFRPFSADQIHTAGKKTRNAKVYAMEKAFRIEAEEKGKKTISILRLDRKTMWVLMPDQKMYMEMPGGPGVAELTRDVEGINRERESLGAEHVGAYQCDKYRSRLTYEGRVYTSIEWAAKELDGFVVKSQGEKGDWSTEYQNVQLGPQDPSLFEIPPGYQKLNFGIGRSRSQQE